jgi:predicted DNA-binding transcriptional regulator YafY
MLAVSLTDETFEMPDDFSPQDYFSEYFGVLTDETPLEHVVIRAYGRTPDYLRTLPLHATQRELSQTDEYTDFSIDIRPTPDFIGQLLNHADGLEVLEPADFRLKIREIIEKTLNRY